MRQDAEETGSSLVASLLALASEDAGCELLEAVLPLLVLPDVLCEVLSEALELWETEVLSDVLCEEEAVSPELVLWEELTAPLELEPEVLAEDAVLSLLLVELPVEADVVPEDAPEEVPEEPELLVLPEPDELLEELVEPELTPLTATFRVLLVTVQSL